MSKGEWTKKFAFLPIKLGLGNRAPIVWFRTYRERRSVDKVERLFEGKKYKQIIA